MPEFIPEQVPAGLDDFTRGYLECAEWLLDESIDRDAILGFSAEAIEQASADCADFQEVYAAQLERYEEVTGRPMDHAGHDFWLTRNHHGAGFWDRGDDPVLDVLTNASQAYGERDLYLGDDGYLYFGG
jgi:hypothetical protein